MVYDTNGVFDVTLIAYSPDGNDTLVQPGLMEVGLVNETTPIVGIDSVCGGLDTLTYSVSGLDSSTYYWSVTGGTVITDDSTDTLVVLWDEMGYQEISVVEVTTDACPGDTQVFVPVIHDKPNTGFVNGDNPVCQEDTLVYNINDGSDSSSYVWVVDSGAVVAGAGNDTVTVAWISEGTGRLAIVETSFYGCVGDTVIQPIIIRNKPDIDSIMGADTTCANAEEVYSVEFHPGSTYLWSVTGGAVIMDDSSETVTVKWDTAGTGTLSVQEQNACTGDTFTMGILINPLPDSSLAISGPDTACQGENGVPYSVTGGNVTSTFGWVASGGTQSSGGTTRNATIDWTGMGTARVGVYEINDLGCGGDTTEYTVWLKTQPTPGFTTFDSTVCGADTGIPYAVSSMAGSTFEWFVTGGSITSGDSTDSITVDWSGVGLGNVSLVETSTESCPSDTLSLTIYMSSPPTPSAISGQDTVCPGSYGNPYVVVGDPVSTFDWTVTGGTITSGATTDSITVTWDTIGPASISVVEDNGCVGSPVDLTIEILPTVPDVTISGPDTACEFTTGYMYVGETLPTGATGAWSVTGGTITAGTGTDTIMVDWDSAGIGEVWFAAIDSNGCSSDTALFLVEIFGPVASFTMDTDTANLTTGGTVNFTNTSSGAVDYSWDFGDTSATSTDVDPTHNYDSVGTFIVTLTASVGPCSSVATDTIYADFIVDKEMELQERFIEAYPNPTDGQLHLNISMNLPEKVEIIMTDMLGRPVIEMSPKEMMDEQLVLDMSSFSKGVYYLQVRSTKFEWIEKIVLAR